MYLNVIMYVYVINSANNWNEIASNIKTPNVTITPLSMQKLANLSCFTALCPLFWQGNVGIPKLTGVVVCVSTCVSANGSV